MGDHRGRLQYWPLWYNILSVSFGLRIPNLHLPNLPKLLNPAVDDSWGNGALLGPGREHILALRQLLPRKYADIEGGPCNN